VRKARIVSQDRDPKECLRTATLCALKIRMDAAEIDLLDQENALLELEDIVARVRAMADVIYDMDIGEVWECLDIWASGGNADAAELLIAFKAAVRRALPALEARS
jgi:hypothetical protein